MTVYTYSEARQKLAALLEKARTKGKVLIRRKDGSVFAVTSEKPLTSPLDVPGVRTNVTSKEIVGFVRESRKG